MPLRKLRKFLRTPAKTRVNLGSRTPAKAVRDIKKFAKNIGKRK